MLCAIRLTTVSCHANCAWCIHSSNVACCLLFSSILLCCCCFFLYWRLSLPCLCRTHLSWSVCPCPSPRERAWHVSVLVKTTVERRATSPCNHPLHHRPPAVLLTHTRHRRVGKAREGWKEAKDRREGMRERGTLGEPWDIWALLFQWDCVLFCSSRHIQMRTWKREQRWENRKKMDLCKVPGVTFLWNKNLSVFFFLFPTSVIVSFFSLVC